MWKCCAVLLFVLCVLLLWMYHLWDLNKLLEKQNCELQQTLIDNQRAAEEKLKRNADELERLQTELNGLRELDHNWLNTALPSDVRIRLQQLCNGYRNACSALRTTKD